MLCQTVLWLARQWNAVPHYLKDPDSTKMHCYVVIVKAVFFCGQNVKNCGRITAKIVVFRSLRIAYNKSITFRFYV